MATMTIIRDAGGKPINIGPWDYQNYINDAGDTVAGNPLPDGATEDTADVTTDANGGRHVTGET